MLLGEKIRLRRKELNISIEALAKATGKNRATIYRYEAVSYTHLDVYKRQNRFRKYKVKVSQ